MSYQLQQLQIELPDVSLRENAKWDKPKLHKSLCAIVNFKQAAINETCQSGDDSCQDSCEDSSKGSSKQNISLSTGFSDLDAILPDGGWPPNDLVEMITTRFGTKGLQLLLPLMKAIIDKGKWVLWIAPPYIPYAPLLVSAGIDISRVKAVQPESTCVAALSSIENGLKDDACGMVIAWLDWLPNSVVRRIQCATKLGNKLGVLFRQHENKNSPAMLRLQLIPNFEGVSVTTLNAQGDILDGDTHFCIS